MTHDSTRSLSPIDLDLDLALALVTGGAPAGGTTGLDFAAIRQQAQSYCPATAAKYGKVNPASVNRPLALSMGNECLAEMGPFQAAFTRGPIQRAINTAFPK